MLVDERSLGTNVFIVIEILSRNLRQSITQIVRHKSSDLLLFCEDNANTFQFEGNLRNSIT